MRRTSISRDVLAALCLFGIILCAHPVLLHAASAPPAGKTRTYYVAADEVQWDYTPSGRDEAMGMEFDEVGRAFTQSGPHRIGHPREQAQLGDEAEQPVQSWKYRRKRGDKWSNS